VRISHVQKIAPFGSAEVSLVLFVTDGTNPQGDFESSKWRAILDQVQFSVCFLDDNQVSDRKATGVQSSLKQEYSRDKHKSRNSHLLRLANLRRRANDSGHTFLPAIQPIAKPMLPATSV